MEYEDDDEIEQISEERRKKAHKEFWAICMRLNREYNVRTYVRSGAPGEYPEIIESWEYCGDLRGRQICRVRHTSETICYEIATGDLQRYERKRKEDNRVHAI